MRSKVNFLSEPWKMAPAVQVRLGERSAWHLGTWQVSRLLGQPGDWAAAPAHLRLPLLSPPATPRRLQDGWLWVLQGHQDFGFSSSYVTHLPQEMTRNWGCYDRRKKSVSPEIQPATKSSTGIVWQGRALAAPAEGTLVKV